MIRLTKHIFTTQMAAILTVMLLIVSCTNKPNPQQKKTYDSIDSFTNISVDTTIALFSSYTKPDCHLKISFAVPDKASSTKTLNAVKTLIVSMNQDGSFADCGTDIDEMVRQYTKFYIINYLEEGQDAIANFGDDMEGAANWMSYEESCRGEVLYNDKGVFSYSVNTFSYTGGAHGNNVNSVASINLSTRKRITLESLFEINNIEKLKIEVLKELNERYQLLNDEIELSDNFFIDERGINFIFDPFELTAYSDGEIKVAITWDKFKALLKKNSYLNNTQFLEIQ